MTEDQIKSAVEHYETLLRKQLARVDEMERGASPVDLANKEKLVIGVIGGDGIGPIIVEQAKRVLDILLKDEIASGRVEIRQIEGLTIENRLSLGQSVPADTLAEIKKCDVLLKGPTTTPKGGTMESANVTLRRENTEGEYVLGSSGIEIPGKLAMDFKVTTDLGTRRIARAAFEFARREGKDNVAIVTKANIMKKTDGNFSRICREVAADYPEIEVEDWYIDIMAANLVNESIRSKFKVFVLPNLYGDIITDEAAQIQGGVGTAGSANMGDRYSMFEAIHGSAPRMIEEGIGDYANPSSIFKAAEMMLSHCGLSAQAKRLSDALTVCNETEKRVVVTGDRNGATCREFADYVIEKL